MVKGASIIMLFYFLGECLRSVSNALTQNMALFFVPAGVGLMASFDLISRYWAALLIVSVVTTAVIIAVVGYMQDKLEKKL